MKRRMEQLINGRFEYEVPALVLSQPEILVQTRVGENYRGELYVGAEDKRRIKGMVMSSNRRILLGKEKFSGTMISIPYGVDVKGLLAGDKVESVITINSNLGEYQIPVKVEILEEQIQTSLGEISTLSDFVKLAENDYREAFRLYSGSNFEKILENEDEKYEKLYRGMSQKPLTYQHMEEFLIGVGKKEPVEIRLDKESRAYDRVESTLKDTLYLYRNTWGFTCMEVEVRGDFLEVEKKVITSEDFIGSVCGLEYLIRKNKLGHGRKYGQIRIRTVYGTLVCEIMASGNSEFVVSTRLLEKKGLAKIAAAYEAYLLGKTEGEEWRKITLSYLGELRDLGKYYPRHQLIETYVYYRLGDLGKAMSALWPLRGTEFSPEEMEEEAVYLALATELGVATDEQKEKAGDRIVSLYQRNPGNWTLLEAILKTDEEYKRSSAKQLYRMEEAFELGCRSPFLYLEALEKLVKEEHQLKKLSPFMLQVLAFGAKHRKLTQELILRIGHLSAYVKNFQPLVYQLLVDCYEICPGKNLLDSLCKYIMKGEPRQKEYFKWYSLAVEQDLRITRLYEYYIETMPEGYAEQLPQVIRMYFVYNNTLSSKKRAAVYANVIRNKEKDRATYQSYRKDMEQFALKSLQEGKINEDFAVIYQACIQRLENAAMGAAMARIMFTHRIFCDDPKVRNVIVNHAQLEREETYPCVDGVAYIRLYTSDAVILFEDEKQRRYAATVDYNLQKLMEEKEYVQQCLAFDVQEPGLVLHICESFQKEIRVRNLICYQHAAQMIEFTKAYRHETCRLILEYYAEHAGDDTLDDYLRRIDYLTFAQVDKVMLTEILIEKGMYDRAFTIITQYGYEGIRPEVLMKMVSRMILQTEFVEHEELVYLALYVFEQGKYDDAILMYLSENLLGPVEQMTLLWERMRGFQLDTYALEEEILLLAMFGRVYLKQGHEILHHYIRQRGKQQVILAYLSFWAYEYFLGEKKTDPFIFECLEVCARQEWDVDRICRLALLKYYGESGISGKEQEEVLRKILEECSEAGLRFGFFKKLPEKYTKPYQLDDKQFVEVRLGAKDKVTIHYEMVHGAVSSGIRKSEPMRNMYQGIFVKEFLLFFGESVCYSLTVEHDGEVKETEEKILRMEDPVREGISKYQLLNQMLSSQLLGQEDQVEAGMKTYLTKERMAQKLFRLVE